MARGMTSLDLTAVSLNRQASVVIYQVTHFQPAFQSYFTCYYSFIMLLPDIPPEILLDNILPSMQISDILSLGCTNKVRCGRRFVWLNNSLKPSSLLPSLPTILSGIDAFKPITIFLLPARLVLADGSSSIAAYSIPEVISTHYFFSLYLTEITRSN